MFFTEEDEDPSQRDHLFAVDVGSCADVVRQGPVLQRRLIKVAQQVEDRLVDGAHLHFLKVEQQTDQVVQLGG